jgi:hypothetical protein
MSGRSHLSQRRLRFAWRFAEDEPGAGGEKKGSGRRNVTAPEFGLKEVGSLFIYIVAAGPLFLTLWPKKV